MESIFWVCEIYVGRQPDESKAHDYALNLVQRICQPWLRKGRNITMDNFFTSVQLAEQFLSQNATILGTMRKNEADIPVELINIKGRGEFSSRFVFSKAKSLVSYVPKKNKNVILLSTMHHSAEINLDLKQKPVIILDYNKTNGGIDSMEKMVKTYTCKRKTNRWPMTLFFKILDVGCIAQFNPYDLKFPNWNLRTDKLRTFLRKVSEDLVHPRIIERICRGKYIYGATAQAIRNMGYSILEFQVPIDGKVKHARCAVCPRSKDNKVITVCSSSKKYTCKEHLLMICSLCIAATEDDEDSEGENHT